MSDAPSNTVDRDLVEVRLEVARAEARREEVERQAVEMGQRVQAVAAIWHSPITTLLWVGARAWRHARRRLSARRPFSWGPLALAGLAHLRRDTRGLRTGRAVSQHTTQPGSTSLGWTGPLDIDRPREALFAHPDSDVVYRMPGPPRDAVFEAWCALHPAAWRRNRTGVTFTCDVHCPSTGWRASAMRTATARFTDRRWRRLAVRVPAGSEDLEVTVSTRFTSDTSVAWGLWGDPRLRWPRTAAEQWHLLRGAVARLRRGGLREVGSALRTLGGAEDAVAAYRRWRAAHTPDQAALDAMRERAASLSWQPLVTVVTPVFNTSPVWLRAAIDSVRRQAYPHWELCLADDASTSAATRAVLDEATADARVRVVRLPRNGGISAATNAAIAATSGELIAFLDHDDELAPEALFRVVERWNTQPDTDVLYSDEDKLDAAGERCEPYFKPEWSPDQFLSFMYTCHLMVARRALVDEVGGLRSEFDGAQDHDLLLRLMARTDRIRHVPGILYHWRKIESSTALAGSAKPWALDAGRRAVEAYLRARGTDGEVTAAPNVGHYRVRYRITGDPLVSIVVPTRGHTRMLESRGVDILTNCLRSIAAHTADRTYEIVVVAEGGRLSDTARLALRDLRHLVVPSDASGPFNFSRTINAGVRASSGSHVLLLNDDTEARDDGWLTAMLELSTQPEIGAVGAKLYYPDGRLQHAGILLGVAGLAAHAFHQVPGTNPGYAGSNILIRNVSAVTGACLLTRRSVFDEVGGFDEGLAIDLNDVDYCLKVRRAGYRVVFTPYAELTHHESASFGARTHTTEHLQRMQERWGDALRADPYYHPALSRTRPNFTLED